MCNWKDASIPLYNFVITEAFVSKILQVNSFVDAAWEIWLLREQNTLITAVQTFDTRGHEQLGLNSPELNKG